MCKKQSEYVSPVLWLQFLLCFQFQVQENPAGGPSTSTSAAADLDTEDDVPDFDDDDDELDMDELNELEASLSRTSIQIKEPGIETSS